MRVEEAIDIARPRREVWAFVADPLNDPRWCPKVSTVEWKKLPRPLHGTFRRGVQRDVRRQLRDLKRLLEQESSAG